MVEQVLWNADENFELTMFIENALLQIAGTPILNLAKYSYKETINRVLKERLCFIQ